MSITFIQANQGLTSSGSTSFGLAYNTNTTAGSFLVAWVQNVTASATLSISDSLNNTWVQLGTTTSAFSEEWAIFYCPTNIGGANTVTITTTVSSGIIMGIGEWTGQSASPFDTGNTSMNSVLSATSLTTASITTAQANETLIFCGFGNNNAATLTPTSFTMRMNESGGSDAWLADSSIVAASAGTYNATQNSSVAQFLSGWVLAIKPTATPPTTGSHIAQPLPVALTNFAGYSLAITSPTTTSFVANPTPVVFTDPNGNEYTITGATKGSFDQQPTPVVLCDSNGRPIVPPIVITSNGNTITVSATLSGNKLGQPVPVALCDSNGNSLTQSGFTYGSETGSPTPVVLCNTNGQPITATIAT